MRDLRSIQNLLPKLNPLQHHLVLSILPPRLIQAPNPKLKAPDSLQIERSLNIVASTEASLEIRELGEDDFGLVLVLLRAWGLPVELEVDGIFSWWEGRVAGNTGLWWAVVALLKAVLDDQGERAVADERAVGSFDEF